TLGRSLPLYCAHCLPPSSETHSPCSVPMKRRSRLTRSSLMTCAKPRTGAPSAMTGVHVLPESEVLYAYGFMSPNVCRSKVAYAVASSKCPGSTLETQAFFGRPAMLATTFVHLLPPSRLT